MDAYSILTLEEHNDRFNNYDNLNYHQKILLLKETTEALNEVTINFKNSEQLQEVVKFMKNFPDFQIIQNDIKNKLANLFQN